MKRLLISILLCALLWISGCEKEPDKEPASSAPAETSTKNPTEKTDADPNSETESEKDTTLSDKSLQLTTGMINGEFQPVCNLFSDKVKASGLTAEMLQSVWQQTVQDLGKLEEGMSSEMVKDEGIRKITVRVEYEKQDLVVLFVYNKAEEIDGLWLKPFPKKSEKPEGRTPRHLEMPIRLGKKPVEGSLMLPKDAEKPPVAILIPGSGPNDRDETIYENRPFWDIAEGLADRGIASLRFDKRSLRYPEDVKTVDDEILNDVREAIRILRTEGRFNFEKIYLLGHSMGGMVAPLLASEHPEVRGIISVAGSPRELEDILYEQIFNLTEPSEEDRKKIEADLERVKTLKEGDTDTPFQIPAVYWLSLKKIRPGETAKALKISMLFLQGEADFQVDLKNDFGEWKKLLNGKPNVTFRSYPKLNHLMMPTQGKKNPSEYQTSGQVDPSVLRDICDWILSQ